MVVTEVDSVAANLRFYPSQSDQEKNRFKGASIGSSGSTSEAVFWSSQTIGFLNHADEMLNILCMDGHVDRRRDWKGKRTAIWFSSYTDTETISRYIDIGN